MCLTERHQLDHHGPKRFLRVWDQTGDIWSEPDSQASLLPQTPFFTNGCLREQLVYPDTAVEDDSTDRKLVGLLELCDLSGLLDRCGGLDGQDVTNWYGQLSTGEQQMVAWARLHYHKPRLAFLDEALVLLCLEDLECAMYKGAKENGITLVSVGHRRSFTRRCSAQNARGGQLQQHAELGGGEHDLDLCGVVCAFSQY